MAVVVHLDREWQVDPGFEPMPYATNACHFGIVVGVSHAPLLVGKGTEFHYWHLPLLFFYVKRAIHPFYRQ